MSIMTIDGSEGEGGGQILRSSMALAVLSNTPITITNIRAGRKKPGLKRQHLTSIRAAAEVCAGTLAGDEQNSSEVSFTPGPISPGTYYFSVGTAGSSTLVLQTVLPILLMADGPSTVVVEGGTHNDMAPPFDFLDRCFLPFVRHMGATVDLTLEQHGFYPAGGGKVIAHITPAPLAGFDLIERGERVACRAEALVSRMPVDIGERQMKTIARLMRQVPAENTTVTEVRSPGPGTVSMIEMEFEHTTELVMAVGRKGVASEKVAKAAVKEANAYLDGDAPVGPHLADQLMMPLALSAAFGDPTTKRGGSFRTGELTDHSTTHIDIISRFLPVDFAVVSNDDDTFTVTVSPRP